MKKPKVQEYKIVTTVHDALDNAVLVSGEGPALSLEVALAGFNFFWLKSKYEATKGLALEVVMLELDRKFSCVTKDRTNRIVCSIEKS